MRRPVVTRVAEGSGPGILGWRPVPTAEMLLRQLNWAILLQGPGSPYSYHTEPSYISTTALGNIC